MLTIFNKQEKITYSKRNTPFKMKKETDKLALFLSHPLHKFKKSRIFEATIQIYGL